MIDRSVAGQLLKELVRTMRVFRATGHRRGTSSISGTQSSMLEYLSRHDARLSEIAGRLHVSLSVASRASEALERQGLIQRRADESDGRAFLMSITPAGERELSARHRYIVDRFTQVLQDWHPGEAQEALGVLKRLNLSLEELFETLATDEND